MNAFEALNKAADAIEARPSTYDFWTSIVGYEGWGRCMLGHVGHVAGYSADTCISQVAIQVLGTDAHKFYDQIVDATISNPTLRKCFSETLPTDAPLYNVRTVPTAMRAVAQKYYAPIPESIQEIFTEKEEA